MKVSIELNYEQLLTSIRQLSLTQRKRLLKALIAEIPADQKPNSLQKLLLHGPTWNEDDYQRFLKTRDQLGKIK